MSALTVAEIAIKIRRRMNAPVSDRLRYAPLIDDALLLLAKDVARDKYRRHLMLTDKDTTSLVLDGSGVGDLTALIATPRVLPDLLHLGEIYHAGNPNPLVQRQQGSRPGNYDAIYSHYILDGVKLRTQSSDNNVTPLPGPLSLAVPFWATLPTLKDELVESLVEKGLELLIENHRDYEGEGDDE